MALPCLPTTSVALHTLSVLDCSYFVHIRVLSRGCLLVSRSVSSKGATQQFWKRHERNANHHRSNLSLKSVMGATYPKTKKLQTYWWTWWSGRRPAEVQ